MFILAGQSNMEGQAARRPDRTNKNPKLIRRGLTPGRSTRKTGSRNTKNQLAYTSDRRYHYLGS